MTPEDRIQYFETDYQAKMSVWKRIMPLSEKAVQTLEHLILYGEPDTVRLQAAELILRIVSGLPDHRAAWSTPEDAAEESS